MSIWAVTGGHLDDISLEDVKRFEGEFLEYMSTRRPEVGEHIRTKGDLPEDVEATLKSAIEDFKVTFVPTAGPPAGGPAARGGPTDELKPDRGWERVAADHEPGGEPPTPEEMREDYKRRAGPVGEAGAPFPG